MPEVDHVATQLNIKDAETIGLARKLAKATGRSITETVKAALRKEDDAREAERVEFFRRVKQISDDFRAHMPADWHGKTSKEIMDEIYDEDGLPI